MRTALAVSLALFAASASADRFTVPRAAGRYLPSDTQAYTVFAWVDSGEPVDVAWVVSYADARIDEDGLLGGLTDILPGGGVWKCPVRLDEKLSCIVNVKAPGGCLVKCGEASRIVKPSDALQDFVFANGGELTVESSGPVSIDVVSVDPVELVTIVEKGVTTGTALRVRVVDGAAIEYSRGGEPPVRVATDKPTGGVLAEGAYVGGPFFSRKVGGGRTRLVKGWYEPSLAAQKPVKRMKSGLDARKRGMR